MKINTNVSALTAANNLSTVQMAIASSSEKLSSGFRINHASDDAAGLGVANSLHSSIRAYTQASSNASQASAVFNIAEGATNSITVMLQRMKELATQSASDTVDAPARTRADNEFQALAAEILRTVDTTQFQNNKVLDGNFGKVAGTISGTITATAGFYSATEAASTPAGSYTLNSTGAASVTLTNGSTTQTLTGVTVGANSTLNFSTFGISISTNVAFANTGLFDAKVVTAAAATGTGGTFNVSASDSTATTGNDSIVATASDFDMKTLTAAATLGNVTSLANAQSAIIAVNAALDQSSTVLGKIGAYQSRVNSAIGNLSTLIQNYTAAESTIRDTDMASEMVKFSKNNILAQAGTAMLAQANQSGQGILKLFQ